MPTSLNVLLAAGGAIITIAAVIKVVIPFGQWMRRLGSRLSGALDNVGGRDSFVDHATGKTVPAIPAIGERFTSIEERLDFLADNKDRLDNHETRLTAVEGKVDGINSAVALALGDKYVAAATAQLAAVEKQQSGAIEAESDE